MSVGKPQNLTPSTTNTQKTQQTVQSQPTPEQKLIGESLNKIKGFKQKWEQGVPRGFGSSSNVKIEKRLANLLSKSNNKTKEDKAVSVLGYLDKEIKEKFSEYGLPTHDRNGNKYSSNFGGRLHFNSKFEDYKNSGGSSKEGIIARAKVRAAMILGLLLQVPESDLKTLRTQLCKGTDQDRDNAIKTLQSKIRQNFQRVDDYSKLPNMLKDYPVRDPYPLTLINPPRRLSLSEARMYNETRQQAFAPSKFTSPKNHDPDSYRLQVHMISRIEQFLEHVIDEQSGKIKNNWPKSARTVSTSVISEKIGTTYGTIGFSLEVSPKRVILSNGSDLSTGLERHHKRDFYTEVQGKSGRAKPFLLKSVDELLNKDTINWYNEVLIQGGTPQKGDPQPEGDVQINGVVVYNEASKEEQEFAERIAEANNLPFLKLGDQTRTENYIRNNRKTSTSVEEFRS